ncbi:FxDxF family PEP-CTERM protein [Pseudoduganella sp. GCM10020061]|uniref:FxDxF family PEP-CTERM protein n=1 Tax=Pseudoduganella sp. GCM10020061 TaxID=3317345 RepID=UPI0036265BE0
MKTMKAFLSALGCASMLLLAPASHAVDISHPPTPVILVDGTGTFGASFLSGNSGNTFSDKYTFSTVGLNFVDTLVGSIAHSALVGLTITGYDLYDSSNALVASGVMQSTGTVDLWTIATGGLPTGSYYVQVTGSIVSNTSASYAGNLNVLAVPEPQTYAMLLAGLGLVAGAARLRAKRT